MIKDSLELGIDNLGTDNIGGDLPPKDHYTDLDEERGSFSGVYLGHRGWNKAPNGDMGFESPNLGGQKSKPDNQKSVAELEAQRKCKRKIYIALALFIVLTVIISIVLIVTVINK